MPIDERGQIVRQPRRRRPENQPHPYYNPFERILSGIGYGLLIIFQAVVSPLFILGIIFHPILVIRRVIRVIISVVLLCPIVIASLFIDPFLLALWIISFGYINKQKYIIIGKTKKLHTWTKQ